MTNGLADSISMLYSAPVVLWVEDELSRDYLSQLWQDDPLVKFCISGGAENIRGVVHDARLNNYRHVFGMIDRDFGKSNRSRWFDEGIEVFILDVHEIENYLLVPEALAGCSLNTGKRSSAEIQGRLYERSNKLCAWMACRKTISEIRGRLFGDFITHPPCEAVSCLKDAEQYIRESDWFSSIGVRTGDLQKSGNIYASLNQADEEYKRHLHGDTWAGEFSGKELFRHVRDWVYTTSNRMGPQRDSDLAKSVAGWQVENESIPSAMGDLLKAIKRTGDMSAS